MTTNHIKFQKPSKLLLILPALFILGCSSTPVLGEKCEQARSDNTVAYTGNANECTCEAKMVINDYKNQLNNVQGIEIDYSSENEMHAKSCMKAINEQEKGINVNIVSQSGDHIYGYHYPMSKYTW